MTIDLSAEELRILIAAKAEGLAKRVDIGSGFKPEDVPWVMERAERILALCQELKK